MVTLIKSLSTIVISSGLVGVVSLAKDLTIAALFGTAPALGAIYFCTSVISFVVNLALGSFQNCYVPAIVHIRSSRPAVARRVAAQCFSAVLIFGALGALFFAWFPYLYTQLAVVLSAPPLEDYVTLPFHFVGILFCLGSINWFIQTELLANKQYFFNSILPIFTPIATLGALAVTGVSPPIEAILVGLVLGSALESAIGCIILLRCDTQLKLCLVRQCSEVRQIFRDSAILVLGNFMFALTEVVDQVMVLQIGAGEIAALTFSTKIPSFLTGIFALGLGRLLLRHFAELIALGKQKEALSLAQRLIPRIAAISSGCALVLAFYSHSITRVLFERGKFAVESTFVVGGIQQGLFLVMPFFITGLVPARLLLALGRINVITNAAVACLVLKVALNFLLIDSLGTQGVAYSSMLVYAMFMTVMLIYLSKERKQYSPVPE